MLRLRKEIHKHPMRLVIFSLLFLFPIITFAVFLALEAIEQSNQISTSIESKIASTSEQIDSASTPEQSKPVSTSGNMNTLFKFSIGFFIIFVALLLLASEKGFLRGFSNWIHGMIDPLITAAPLGMFVSMIYLFILTNTQASDFALHFGSATGLYVVFVGLFVAFHGIYTEKTLILDIDTFMDHIIEDIDNIEGRFFWCYPGLSFGSVSAKGDRYQDFRQKLLEIFVKKKIRKEVYVFAEPEILLLYEAYKRNATKIKDVSTQEKELNQINEAIDDSILFIRIFKWGQGDKLDPDLENKIGSTIGQYVKKGKRKKEEDINQYRVNFTYNASYPAFRFQVVIIDDKIYVLTPFGLPQRFGDVYEFTHNPDLEHPVDFHVTRIVSEISAEVLIDQIRKEYEKITQIEAEKQIRTKKGGLE